ncbi:hypothetical protein PHYC_02653 [Phycisphaerales bacterium]|nr:hypothetical protein PHYC_02653 [Phycisphaerales bacterium]
MNPAESKQLAAPQGATHEHNAPFAGLSPEELAGKSRGRRGKTSTQVVILLLVVGVSAVSLWWMRREGTKVGVNFQELKVDYSEPDAEKARTYARIMTDLARIQTPLDVALGEFGKSPFMLDSGKAVVSENGVSVPAGPDPQEVAAREAAERAEARRQELLTALENLRLQSLMGGRVPLARIDDRTVRVGDEVGGVFTVTAIEGRTVTLAADGQTFTLTIDEQRTTTPKRAPVKMGTPSKKSGK